MKKKNRFKSWLIKTLSKWLNKLAPEENVLKIEHTEVPLITLSSSVTVPKDYMSEDRIAEILSKKLSDEVAKYMRVDTSEYINFNFDSQIVYRATIIVVADK